jgi:hypothetical protein
VRQGARAPGLGKLSAAGNPIVAMETADLSCAQLDLWTSVMSPGENTRSLRTSEM